MKLKKLFAAAAAAAVAVSAMALNVSAANEFNAKIGFADTVWAAQDWDSSVTVTGDGTYTVESTAVAGAIDLGVFVIDIEGMYAAAPEATAVLDKIEIDGKELSFKSDLIIYGDVEEKGNYRIEIYNIYGNTFNDPGVNAATPINESVKVTFTVSGLPSAEAPAETPAETSAPAATETTTSAGTGNASSAVILSVMAIAGAAALVSKRRK